MVIRRSQVALVPVFLVAALTLVGCAKRPAVMMAGAPAGIGVAAGVQSGAVATQERTTAMSQGAAATTQQSEAAATTRSGAAGSSGASTTEYGRAQSAATAGAQSEAASRQVTAAPSPVTAAPSPVTAAPSPVTAAPSQGAAAQPSASPGATVAQTAPRPDRRDFETMSQLEPIYFDFDKSEIRADATRTLQTNANWFRSNPNYLILIEGHCDERGTNEYNLALGERRARSTMNFLMAQGVASSRMTIISYGEERPACTERNEACWAKNRRAAFLVKETVPSALPAAVTGAGAPPAATGGAPAVKTGGDPVTEPVSSPSQPGASTPPNPQRRQQAP